MSYLNAQRLTEELKRLYAESGGDPESVFISDAQRHRFDATLNGIVIKFSVPEDELHSASLGFVSDRYLKPLLVRADAGFSTSSPTREVDVREPGGLQEPDA